MFYLNVSFKQLLFFEGFEPQECHNRISRNNMIQNDGVDLSRELTFDGKLVNAHYVRDIALATN